MPIEYQMLAAAVGVLAIVLVVQGTAGVLQYGLAAAAGNRDGLAPAGFHARARRCLDNHIEGLALFAPLALIAGQTGAFDATTALGAQLFAAGRAAHAALYLIGVPWLRTLAFAVSLTGTALLAASLFGLA